MIPLDCNTCHANRGIGHYNYISNVPQDELTEWLKLLFLAILGYWNHSSC